MDFHCSRVDSDAPHVSGPFSGVSERFLIILDVLERKIDALERGADGKCPDMSGNRGGGRGVQLKVSGNVRKIAFQQNRHFEILSGNLFMPGDSGMYFYMVNNL